MKWWDADAIEATVTRQFVCSYLLPDEIARLDLPLGFGDGLTDGTYWEWIDEKAKRIFLILIDLGMPDQIFGIIDDSWDDQDLPIALDQVERLALTPTKDEKSERRFYQRQFYYLLKMMQPGEHVEYEDSDVVPLDVVDRKPGLSQGSHYVDRVLLPNQPGKVFCRRRIPLGSGPGCLDGDELLYEINSIKNVQNEHLVSYWGSYVHQDDAYVLFTPASDFTLKSFLATTPTTVKNLEKYARRVLVLNWIHCLVDTLCYIHNRGLSHGNIKPSTVMFNNNNHIFYSDFTRLNGELLAGAADKTSFDKEAYDYAAPEQWFRPSSAATSPVLRRPTLTSLSTSPDNTTFAISRTADLASAASGAAAMHAPTPHLNPQAADVFSLGCVILELLSFVMKRQSRAFAAHRAARHKTPGRGGAVLDSSFHKNLGQVESWMTGLAREAAGKIKKQRGGDDEPLRGLAPMLHVVERMLAAHPAERPAAHDVQARMYEILHDGCGIAEPHCVHRYGGWDFGIGSLKLSGGPASPSRRRPMSPGGAGGDEGEETMSIMTKRSSGGSRGAAASGRPTSWGSSRSSTLGANTRPGTAISGNGGGDFARHVAAETPRDRFFRTNSAGSGFGFQRDLRFRTDRARQWQQPPAPVYVGN